MSAAFHPLDGLEPVPVDTDDGGHGGGGVSTDVFLLALLVRAGNEGPFIRAAVRRLIRETAEAFVAEQLSKGTK